MINHLPSASGEKDTNLGNRHQVLLQEIDKRASKKAAELRTRDVKVFGRPRRLHQSGGRPCRSRTTWQGYRDNYRNS